MVQYFVHPQNETLTPNWFVHSRVFQPPFTYNSKVAAGESRHFKRIPT